VQLPMSADAGDSAGLLPSAVHWWLEACVAFLSECKALSHATVVTHGVRAGGLQEHSLFTQAGMPRSTRCIGCMGRHRHYMDRVGRTNACRPGHAQAHAT
jgi:hypothetical protein